jgi:hypothetical protein
MGDCAFSERCRRSKASGAAVPGPVCVSGVLTGPRPSNITRQSGVGQAAKLSGKSLHGNSFGPGWVISIRHCDEIRSVQPEGIGATPAAHHGVGFLAQGPERLRSGAIQRRQNLSRRRPVSSMCGVTGALADMRLQGR